MAQQLAQAEVCVSSRSMQVWTALIDWLAFQFQIFYQILSQFFSHIALPQSLLSSSSSSSSSPSFKPLPAVELPLAELSPPHTASPADVRVVNRTDDQRLNKLTVVLDLDETLVCAYEKSSVSPALRNRAIEAGLKWFELECRSSDEECEGNPKVSYVTVFERPGLHKFLKQISQFADIVLFTAGLEDYARPLVDKIDVENRFCLRLYRPSTVSTEFRQHVKDLSCLSKDLCRTVIVDNNPFSFLLQPLNGIPCTPFSAGQPHDEQLLETLLPLLRHLSLQKDVRPVLDERFHMAEWFQMHGIRAPIITV